MNRTLRTTLITTVASLMLVAGAALPASATPTGGGVASKTLAEIQASAVTKTNARITALNTAITRITANRYLTDGDRATILATLNADLSGLGALKTTIAADTTAGQAASDYRKIFTEYRVYAVAIPQSRFAAAADGLASKAIPRLTDAHQKLADALAGKYADKSTPELQAKLADMQTRIASATSSLNGLASAALAVTPAAFNANHAVMQPIRQSLRSAAAALKLARADARFIVAALK